MQRRIRAVSRMLDAIERLGNRLPDPVLIFVWLIVAVIVLSVVGAAAGWQAVNPVTQQTFARSQSATEFQQSRASARRDAAHADQHSPRSATCCW